MGDKRTTVRHITEIPLEGWDDQSRGSATWRTLFSADVTATSDLTTGVCVIPVGSWPPTGTPWRSRTSSSTARAPSSWVTTLFTVRAGSAVMISADTVHATRNTGDRPLRFFYVFATGSFDDVHYVFA